MIINKFFGKLIREHYWKSGKVIIPINHRKHFEEYKQAVKTLHAEKGMSQTKSDSFLIFSLVKKTAKLNGLIAEMGVYKGKNAQLICKAKGERKLFLFDTWEGLPASSEYEHESHISKGFLKADLSKLKERLKDYPNVEYRKGVIENTLKEFEGKAFAFVYLDLDLYDSTKFALNFLYPRMCKGGIIMTDDYPDLKGVKMAFDEFFKDKPEIIYDANETQGFIQKC